MATGNTVNMMIARIQGAPAGAKGISLFVVPKYRLNDEGQLEYNDLSCDGIEHPDIKRMLLMQKSIAEGGLALALQVSKYLDLAKVVATAEEREKYTMLVELLVPVVKTYPAEAGILATSAAIQCLGGYGYCQDFPVEQYYRDIRIDPIHEGTTGVQGQDILNRKISLGKGKAMQYFVAELLATIQKAQQFDYLQDLAAQLLEALNELRSVTTYLLSLSAQGQVEEFLADGVLYLEMFSLITIAWQWLLQAITVAMNSRYLQAKR